MSATSMNLVFDTSALSSLLSRNENTIKAVSSQPWERLIIPLAADAELRFEFKYGSRAQKNAQIYQQLLAAFGIEIACPDQNTAILYADLAAWCRKGGLSLSHNDLWIAAAAMQNTAQLLTMDQDFRHLPQISLVA